MFNGSKLARVSLTLLVFYTRSRGRCRARIFPTNEAWPNRRLTAENGGSEWQNGGGSVVESRASGEHARSLRQRTVTLPTRHGERQAVSVDSARLADEVTAAVIPKWRARGRGELRCRHRHYAPRPKHKQLHWKIKWRSKRNNPYTPIHQLMLTGVS